MPWLSPGRVSWDVQRGGRYPACAVPVQRGTSRTGRSAGRADARSRPGAWSRTAPAGTALAPSTAVTGDVPSIGEIR